MYLGNIEISAAYLGSVQIYGGHTPVYNPESNLGTPAATAGPSQFDWTPPAITSQPAVFAFDLVLPSTPPTSGMIFEQGGAGSGALIIVRQGHMRFRFGDGGVNAVVPTQGYIGASNAQKYVWDVPISSLPFDGNQHTIVWQVEPRNNGATGHRAWIDGVELFNSSGLGVVESNQWSGSAGGGFLTHNTNMGDETNYDTNWPVQAGQARMYLNISVT